MSKKWYLIVSEKLRKCERKHGLYLIIDRIHNHTWYIFNLMSNLRYVSRFRKWRQCARTEAQLGILSARTMAVRLLLLPSSRCVVAWCCVCACIHIRTCICMHIYACIYTLTTHLCLRTHTCYCWAVGAWLRGDVCVRVHLYAHTCAFIYMYAYIHWLHTDAYAHAPIIAQQSVRVWVLRVCVHTLLGVWRLIHTHA